VVSALKKKVTSAASRSKKEKQQADPMSEADVSRQNCLFASSVRAFMVSDASMVKAWSNDINRPSSADAMRRLTFQNQIALEMILSQFLPSAQRSTPCAPSANAARSYVRATSMGAESARFDWRALDETSVETSERVGTPTILSLSPQRGAVLHFATSADLLRRFTSEPSLAGKSAQVEVFRMNLAPGSRTLGDFTRKVPGGEFMIRARARLLTPKVEFVFAGRFGRFPRFPSGTTATKSQTLLFVPGNTVAIDVGQNRLEALNGLLVLTLESGADANMLNVVRIDIVVPSRLPRVKLV
jgi:hypothetical protein